MHLAECVSYAPPVRFRLRRTTLNVSHDYNTISEQPSIGRRDRHRHGQTFTVKVFEQFGFPCEIRITPDTETTDRKMPVDAHGPHVVGFSASERFYASDIISPLRECFPSHPSSSLYTNEMLPFVGKSSLDHFPIATINRHSSEMICFGYRRWANIQSRHVSGR